jgi:hypothetical protein
MDVDQDSVDQIIEGTRERIERMKALTAQTQGLLKSHDKMAEESDKHQAYKADAEEGAPIQS